MFVKEMASRPCSLSALVILGGTWELVILTRAPGDFWHEATVGEWVFDKTAVALSPDFKLELSKERFKPIGPQLHPQHVPI